MKNRMRAMIVVTILAVGCTSKVSEDRLNAEAVLLHNSMIKKATMISNRLNELKGDPSVDQDSVSRLSVLFEQWESDLIEVPGSEHHDHDHDSHEHHSHDHDHATPDVTPAQMLEIQKELDTRLSMIGKRTTQLKSQHDNAHQH